MATRFLLVSVILLSGCAGTNLHVNSAGTASISTPVELGIARCHVTASGRSSVRYGVSCGR